jgi:hypothetical protein
MTVFLVNSLPKIPYIHRIYMVLANPTYNNAATSDLGQEYLRNPADGGHPYQGHRGIL